MPRCKSCGDKFEQYEFNNKFCKEEDCQVSKAIYNLTKIKDREQRQWKERQKEMKEELKTVQDLMKEAQVVFNEYIRLRDKGKPCISCQNKTPKKVNAGHYIASGKSKFLTFNEDNVHLQCEYCNTFLSSNAVEYRVNLINKIGLDRVEWLEENRHKTKKYTRAELIEIKEYYKKKVKTLKS